MSSIDPHDRTDLTGTWAGFGFQGGHMFTPEGHSLEPGDMSWWSLTCNIAREWRAMMDECRSEASRIPCATDVSGKRILQGAKIIYLRDAIRARRQRRLGRSDPDPAAEPSNVVHLRRGPKSRQRG